MDGLQLQKTVLNPLHVEEKAKIVSFAGWEMPLLYTSTPEEHLLTRTAAGKFDISHMGRFLFSGPDAAEFLQNATTNHVYSLSEPGRAQYTFIQNRQGSAHDDAYIYRIGGSEYLLVVNASNAEKDWQHLASLREYTPSLDKLDFSMLDLTQELAMIALQGPKSEDILEDIINSYGSGTLPINRKNRISEVKLNLNGNHIVYVSRTGYTGEPNGFELFVPEKAAPTLWQILGEKGVASIGLGARDTLRTEAGYPLYGHELGIDLEGKEIPAFALPLAMSAVKVNELKGDYYGREALVRQYLEVTDFLIRNGNSRIPLDQRLVPRRMLPIAVLNDKGDGPDSKPIWPGDEVHKDGKKVGYVSSGAAPKYANIKSNGFARELTGETSRRSVGIAYVSGIIPGELGTRVEIKTTSPKRIGAKGPAPVRSINAMIVKDNIIGISPYAHAIVHPVNYGR